METVPMQQMMYKNYVLGQVIGAVTDNPLPVFTCSHKIILSLGEFVTVPVTTGPRQQQILVAH